MIKTYVLLRDSFDANKGTEFELDGGHAYKYITKTGKIRHVSVEFVQNNSEWFSVKKKEEIKSNDSFQWTDELVEGAVQHALNDDNPSPLTPYGVKKKIEQFKQSHTPKPQAENKPDRGWEIISFKYRECIMPYTGQTMFPDVWKIHSVKRLSDGEVFSVGDEVDYCGIANKITGFQIYTGAMFAKITPHETDVNAIAPISDISKPAPQPQKEEQPPSGEYFTKEKAEAMCEEAREEGKKELIRKINDYYGKSII